MRIAIVGIGCRYPGAGSPRELFENLLAGRRYFRTMPPERWKLEDYYDSDRARPDTTYSRQAALIEGFEFNPAAFRVTQRTYTCTDQAQWLALQTASEALKDASLKTLPQDTTAVVLGNSLTGETSRTQILRFRWPYAKRVFGELLSALAVEDGARDGLLHEIERRYKAPLPEITEDTLAGSLSNTIAGRVCNYFDFHGGGYTVDGACSSSLLAVIDAAKGLVSGDFDVALAGGVDISLDPFELVGFARVGALSDGEMRVYDDHSRGFLPGEGCGIVVLKRLEDAVRDGDRVYGVLTGWGISSDGRGGLTAPSVAGQALAIGRAYARAGYSLSEVDLIEGHGTGTPLGDQVELSAVLEARRRQGIPADHACAIGSIKSNIGHTKAAAGVAGFIKATLAVHYRLIPPTLGIRRRHRLFSDGGLFPAATGREWPADRVARASVSSAGFGGINTHVTLEEPPAGQVDSEEQRRLAGLLASGQDAEAFFFSGRHAGELVDRVRPFAEAAARISTAELSDLAARSAGDIGPGMSRLAVVAASPDELASRLQRALSTLDRSSPSREIVYCDPAEGIYMRTRRSPARVAFLFPGQGSQRLNASRVWRARFPQVRAVWARADEALQGFLPAPLASYVFRDVDAAADSLRKRWLEELTETSIAQPAILVASMAWAELLRYLGVEADLVLGHSLGEYGALWYAEAMDTPTALRLVALRGRAMSAPAESAGAMLSISQTPELVRELLAQVSGYAEIANYNGPRATVVSGEGLAIEQLRQLCIKREIGATRLAVSNAFHSRLMKDASRAMRSALADAEMRPPRRMVVSSSTGGFVPSQADLHDLLARQVTEPVRFSQALEAALEADADVFVEVGPGTVLTRLARQIAPEGVASFLAVDPDPETESVAGVLHAVAYCYASGADLRPERLFEGRLVRPIALPYQPRFIGSPCEAPAEPIRLATRAPRLELAVLSAPSEVAPPPNGGGRVLQLDVAPDILGLLRQYIVDTFGYPLEMVGPSSRMTEDLNLDSIKVAEVVAVAMERLGVKSDPSTLMGLDLGSLASRLADLRRGHVAAVPAAAEHEPAAAEETPPARWVRAFETRLVQADVTGPGETSPSGPVMVVAAEETPFVCALRDAFRSAGVELLGREELGNSAPGPGCCILVAPEPDASPESTLAVAGAFAWFSLMFDSLQAFLAHGSPARRMVGLVVPTLSAGRERGWSVRRAAGAAMVKTAALEHPGLETRVVEVDGALPLDARVASAWREFVSGSGHVHSVHDAAGRRVPELFPLSPAELPAAASLQPGEVVLVTGGAKGVTAHLARAVAEAKGVRLALIGRTTIEEDPGREIASVMEELKGKGIEAQYFACDVTDDASVARLIQLVHERFGPVAAVIHGAGTTGLHRLLGGRLSDFLATLKPKVMGLSNLIRHLDLSRLRCFVALSSVIGDSGMIGNADYAFANEWMNLALARLRAAHPATSWLSYGFSIWDEVGMGFRMGSIPLLRRMGIDPVPPAEGARLFLDLLDRQWPDAGLVVAAPLGVLPTLQFARAGRREGRFFETVISDQPGVELEVEFELSPDRDAYVREHDYQGSLLLPAVIGMEAMARVAEAALMLPGRKPPAGRPSVRDARFGRPVVVPPGGRKVRIHALVRELGPDGAAKVHATVRSAITDFKTDHFACDVVWDGVTLPSNGAAVDWPGPLPVDPAVALYKTLLFQGPMFRNVIAYHSLSPTSCLATVRVPPGDPTGLGPTLLGAPEVRDAFLHSIQPCVPEYRILPVSIDCIRSTDYQGSTLYLSATERYREERDFVYDVEVRDGNGRLVERLEAFRCRSVDRYEDAATLSVIRHMHALSQEWQAQQQSTA